MRFPVPRWLGAVTLTAILVGLVTFAIADVVSYLFVAVVAAMVFAASASICTFLIDAGLLFEELFANIARLVVPGFAFCTFYSLLVIVFAAIYRIIDNYSAAHHFVIDGARRQIDFAESLYFSLVTMSTVGYGDILPASDIVRVIVAIQIMLGVLLLLFGFWEIASYASDRRRHDRSRIPARRVKLSLTILGA